VRIVVPSAAGGGFDLVGRVLAPKLGEQTGQAFVAEKDLPLGSLKEVIGFARAHLRKAGIEPE